MRKAILVFSAVAMAGALMVPHAAQAWWRGEQIFPAEIRLHDWFPPVKGKLKKRR